MKKYLLLLLIAICFVSYRANGDDPTIPETYTVIFDSKGGSAVNPVTGVGHDSTIGEPEEPFRANHTFAGWFIDYEAFAEQWDFETQTVTEDVTLYAKWDEIRIGISTAAELNAVRNDLSGNYILLNDISLAEYDNWMPIGSTEDAPFIGKFDGNGHRITDLTINRPAGDYVGLFGCIDSGYVADLGVEIGAGGINGGAYTGGVAGLTKNITLITNCYSTGDITANNNSGNAGGISGHVYNSTITDCHSTGNITGSSSGGIVGRIPHRIGLGGNIVTIINCHSTGNITGRAFAGGIVGFVSVFARTGGSMATIMNCYSMGNITGSSSGGIAGAVDGRGSVVAITKCYSTGNITADMSSGGIVGDAMDGMITNCYSTGNISSSSYTSIACSGGIVGRTLYGGTIADCYSTGNISSYTSCSPSSCSTGAAHSGGIVGLLSGGAITNSYSTGDISSSSSLTRSRSGGIVGETGSGRITNCAAINPSINSRRMYTERIVGRVNYSLARFNNLALDKMVVKGNRRDGDAGIDKTIDELQQQSTYETGLGWDFATTWKMPVGGSGFPILQWQ
ncbi:MAG: InlB B-repeat-containing protein [Rikenellaceae bacterium]|nr:InlB B-repeat-containing protein [Rikenellaceae bacterium]